MIYLASPYAHPDPIEMQYRFECACQAVACLMNKGCVVYSPIAHNHFIAQNHDLPRTWDFWAQFDLPMLSRADELWVLQLDGWHISKGIEAETAFALNIGKPVIYISLDEVCCGKDSQHSGN